MAATSGRYGSSWPPQRNAANISTHTILSKWRDLIGEIPGVERLTFATLEGGPAGNPIEIQLSGQDFDQLKQAAAELEAEIANLSRHL